MKVQFIRRINYGSDEVLRVTRTVEMPHVEAGMTVWCLTGYGWADVVATVEWDLREPDLIFAVLEDDDFNIDPAEKQTTHDQILSKYYSEWTVEENDDNIPTSPTVVE